MSVGKLFGIEEEPSVVTLTLHGDISSFADSRVLGELEEIQELLGRDAIKGLIVDLSETSYFGSSILEALRVLWTTLDRTNRQLVLCHVTEGVREILALAHFDRLWPIVETRQDARAKLGLTDG